MDRIYHIHDMLRHARRPVPMARFMDALETSRNSVTRYFTWMRDHLGAPITYDREYNGHCYDPKAPVFELPGLWMNSSELYALLACERLLETVQPGLMEKRLAPLRERIRKLLGESGHDAEQLNRRVSIQLMQQRPQDQYQFAIIADATLGQHQLAFDYHGRARAASSQRQVSPQRLIHYRSNWYLLGYCHQANDLRLFSLDKISQPVISEQQAQSIDEPTLNAFTQDSFGIFTGHASHTAHLRFTATAARWVADEIWHPQQQAEWHDDGYHLKLPYGDATELTMEILRYGAEVEVLGPPALRGQVAGRVREMAAKYCPDGQ